LEVIEAGSIKKYQPGYRFLWNPGIQAIFLSFFVRHSFDIHATTAMMVTCSANPLLSDYFWAKGDLATAGPLF
jgi:hypothetical protein